jgi:hypothetical protein
MKAILKPLSGTAEGNLDRARLEIDSVLNFRGSVTSVKAEGKRIIVEFEINPAWDLPDSEKVKSLKVKSLKEWIPAKVRTVFKVIRVSAKEYQ